MIKILGIGFVITVILALLWLPFKLASVFIRLALRFAKWSAKRGWKNVALLAQGLAAFVQIIIDLAVSLAFVVAVYAKAALDRLREIIRRPS